VHRASASSASAAVKLSRTGSGRLSRQLVSSGEIEAAAFGRGTVEIHADSTCSAAASVKFALIAAWCGGAGCLGLPAERRSVVNMES
jgi:hypothetical protein